MMDKRSINKSFIIGNTESTLASSPSMKFSSSLSSNLPAIEQSPFTKGYTGKRPDPFKNNYSRDREDYFIIESATKFPSVGYSGWYKGKISGSPGKCEVPKKSISECEENDLENNFANSFEISPSTQAIAKKTSHNISSDTPESIQKRYIMALEESSCTGFNSERVLDDLKYKIQMKYPNHSEKYKYVKKLFGSYDIYRNNFINEYDFKLCLSRLGIELPKAQILSIMSNFDENYTGNMNYQQLLKRIC